MRTVPNGFVFRDGQGIAFDYARKTKSGRSIGRLGLVDTDKGSHVIIRELVNGREQYRSFHKSAMLNVVLNTD
jgi:hypothetical protein